MTPKPSGKTQRCPDCGAACERLTPSGPLVGSALWACVVGAGDEQILTRRGEILTGCVIPLNEAPKAARIGRKLHTCKRTK